MTNEEPTPTPEPPKKNQGANIAMALVFAIAAFIVLLTFSPWFRAAVEGFLGGMGG